MNVYGHVLWAVKNFKFGVGSFQSLSHKVNQCQQWDYRKKALQLRRYTNTSNLIDTVTIFKQRNMKIS